MEEILSTLDRVEFLSFDQSFDLAQTCSIMLDEDSDTARKLIINVLHYWYKLHVSTIEVWTDIVESAGFYPYIQKNKEHFRFANLYGELRHGMHQSNNLEAKYFHDEQFEVLQLLKSDKNVIVSAPTSFGKSLLIEEIVASGEYKNIVIIQPTLALLDETRRKLQRYKNIYKLVVRTSQQPSIEKGNIFLFTAERVNEYQEFPKIDFLIIDEFYKLSGRRDDERSSSLNNAFYFLLKTYNPKFYLLGPNIDGISIGFVEKYNAVFFKSKYSLVDSRSVSVFSDHENKFGIRGKKKEYKESVLFQLLLDLNEEQTIIYCSSPARVRFLAKAFVSFLNSKLNATSQNIYPLTEWIKSFVSEDWCVLDYLSQDIGIHDGALQKHISTSIIEYFNDGKIKYLFCTSTIIEGINTSAKNIVYFDYMKGTKPVDYFDYSNIKGRAGRMMIHYIGKIFNFNPPPPDELIIIDIPFFQQNPIKDEVLIQLSPDEIIDLQGEQYKELAKLPENERLLIKRNCVQVKGQKSLIDILRQDVM